MNAMNRSVEEGTGGALRIEAPFVRWNKAQIVREGLRLHVPYELTWSCYEGGERPCGKCGTCLDRLRAFEANGVSEPGNEVTEKTCCFLSRTAVFYFGTSPALCIE